MHITIPIQAAAVPVVVTVGQRTSRFDQLVYECGVPEKEQHHRSHLLQSRLAQSIAHIPAADLARPIVDANYLAHLILKMARRDYQVKNDKVQYTMRNAMTKILLIYVKAKAWPALYEKLSKKLMVTLATMGLYDGVFHTVTEPAPEPVDYKPRRIFTKNERRPYPSKSRATSQAVHA